MTDYVWHAPTPSGEQVPLTRRDVEAFALIQKHFPDAKAVELRRPGQPPRPLIRGAREQR